MTKSISRKMIISNLEFTYCDGCRDILEPKQAKLEQKQLPKYLIRPKMKYYPRAWIGDESWNIEEVKKATFQKN